VHIPRLAADEGFVGFDPARNLVDGSHSQGVADSAIHEPRRLLSDAYGPVNLIGTDAVFAVHHLPHRHKPLIDTEGGILKDGSGLRSELAGIVARAALPAVVLFQKLDVLAATAWAFDAIRPAARYEVLAAIFGVRKINNGVPKGIERGFHDLTLSESA
jgi:hypothetical protein